jgi:hypothetical protein
MSTSNVITTGGGSTDRVYETIAQTAHGFVVTQPIYHDGSEWKASIAAPSGATVTQAVVTSVTDANTFEATTHGVATVAAHGLTVGEYYWLDQVTSIVTATQPLSGIAQGILHVRDVDMLFIDVEQATLIEVGTATETLHYLDIQHLTAGSGGSTSIAAVTTTIGAGYTVLDLGDTDLTSTDPKALINPTNNTVVIKQAGLYKLDFSMTVNTFADCSIRNNGTLISANFNNDVQFQEQHTFVTIDLVVGDVLEFSTELDTTNGTSVWAVSISVMQMPIGTIIPPVISTIENLHRVGYSASDNTAVVATILYGSDYRYDIDVAAITNTYNPQSLIDFTNDRIIIQNAGTYRIDGVAFHDSGINSQIRINGVVVHSAYPNAGQENLATQWMGLLNVGDTVEFGPSGVTLARNVSFNLEQLPVGSLLVIPEVVATNVALHYVDLQQLDAGVSGTDDIDMTATTIGSGYNVINFSDVNLITTHDPQSLVALGNNSITITQDGLYELNYTVTWDSASEIAIHKNGVIISASFNNVTAFVVQTTSVLVDLVIGDTLEFGTVDATVVTGCYAVSISVSQQPDAIYVAATNTIVENLHRAGYGASGALDVVASSGAPLKFDIDNVNITSTYDPNSMINYLDNTVEIQIAGLYKIESVVYHNTSAISLELRINNVVMHSAYPNSSGEHLSVQWLGNLNVGDAVAVGPSGVTTASGLSFSLEALPSASVFTPDVVAVETLHRTRLRDTTGGSTIAGDNDLTPAVADYNIGGIGTSGVVTITQGGLYRLAASFGNTVASNNSQVYVKLNGVKVARSIDSQTTSGQSDLLHAAATLDLSAGDVVVLGVYTGGSGTKSTVLDEQPTLEVVQLSSYSVLNQDVVPVLDQTTATATDSGYFDIGAMRMQWGVTACATAGQGSQTIIFPVVYGGAPMVQLTARGNSSNSEMLRLNGTPTTTSFAAYKDSTADSGSSWTTADDIHWFAIGPKP